MKSDEHLAARNADFVDLSWIQAGNDTPSCLLPVDQSRPADPNNSIKIDCEKQLVKLSAGSTKTQVAGLREPMTYLAASKTGQFAQPKVRVVTVVGGYAANSNIYMLLYTKRLYLRLINIF